MTKFLTIFPDLGDPGARVLHPAATGVDITLTGTAQAEQLTSTDDATITDDLTANDLIALASAIAPYFAAGTNPATDGPVRIPNNVMMKARNALNNANLDLIGTNGSNGLVLGSGLSGLLLGASSVISALALGSALQMVRVNSGGSALEFFDMPVARVYHNTTQTANNGSATNWLQFNSNRRLVGVTQANGNATNSRLVAPVAGLYLAVAQVVFPADTTGTLRRVGVYFNNTTTIGISDDGPPAGTNIKSMICIAPYYLTANQFVEAFCVHDATGNLTIGSLGNYSPEFSLVRIG